MKRQTGSVLVLSLPKSGSSMLFQSLREAMPTVPANMEQLDSVSIAGIRNGLVCKQVFQSAALVRTQREKIACFDKLIMLVRDPRDRLVSAMLYAAYNMVRSPTQRLISLLPSLVAKKERLPSSVSCTEIVRCLQENGASGSQMGSDLAIPGIIAEAESSQRPLLTVRYEDLIRGDGWRQVSEHVGVEIGPPQESTPLLRLVHRSARSGDWRHWFTPEDVEMFRPLFSDLIASYDYDPDWTLASPQLLDPEHGSRFVNQCIGLALRRRVR